MRRLLFILFVLSCCHVWGQGIKNISNPNDIFSQIQHVDSSFFQSLNNCDLKKYASFLTEDFEFYHDKAGLTKSKSAEMKSMSAFCGEQRQRQKLRRELIKGSADVSTIKNFGAVHTGRHRFYLVIDDKTEKLIEEAKFTNVWQLQDSVWKLSRSISYDHQPASKVQLSQKTLNLYPGRYKMNTGSIIVVSTNRTVLIAQDGSWFANLHPESESTFYLDYGNTQFEFIRGKTGGADRLVIYENGKQIDQGARME